MRVKTTAFDLSLKEADSLSALSNEDKLKTCIYTDDFAQSQPRRIEENRFNTSVSTKRKTHHKQKIPSNPSDGDCLKESSMLEEFLSIAGKNFDLRDYLQYKSRFGSIGTPAPLESPTTVQTANTKKSGRTVNSQESLQPRQRKEKKNQPSFDDEPMQQRREMTVSVSRMSIAGSKDCSALVCPNKLCSQSRSPSSMKEILEAEEEAQKELEIIENMLHLVQGGNEVGGAEVDEEQKGRMEEGALEAKKDVEEEEKAAVKEKTAGEVEEKKKERLEEKEKGKVVMEKVEEKDGWVGDLFGGIEKLDGNNKIINIHLVL